MVKFQQAVNLKIRIFSVPKNKHAFLHLLTDKTSQKTLTASVSEMYCLFPLTPDNIIIITRMAHFKGIKLIKRLVNADIANSSSKQKYIGLCILVQLMIPIEFTNKLNDHQIVQALKELKQKREELEALYLKYDCQFKRISRKEHLRYLEGGINEKDVVFFKELKNLIQFLPNPLNSPSLTNPSSNSPNKSPLPQILELWRHAA